MTKRGGISLDVFNIVIMDVMKYILFNTETISLPLFARINEITIISVVIYVTIKSFAFIIKYINIIRENTRCFLTDSSYKNEME